MTRPSVGRSSWPEHASDSESRQGTGGGHSAGIGLLAGMALGFAGYFGGFWAFLLVTVMGVAGLVTGLALDGSLDLGALVRARGGRR
ncbi:hypothetical protein ACXKR8_015310 [Streptacidiphilus sp. PAMC 29251]